MEVLSDVHLFDEYADAKSFCLSRGRFFAPVPFNTEWHRFAC